MELTGHGEFTPIKLRASTTLIDDEQKITRLTSWRIYCVDPVMTPFGLVERGPVKIYERWIEKCE